MLIGNLKLYFIVIGFLTIDVAGLTIVTCLGDSTIIFFLLGRRIIFMGSTKITNDC